MKQMIIKQLQRKADRFDVRVEMSDYEHYTFSAHGFLANIQAFMRTLPVEFTTQTGSGVYFTLRER